MQADADVASVAAAMGNPARERMLCALLGGRGLPASELARAGGVSSSTASAHLALLVEVGLVDVEVRGRHRVHRLAGPEVAHVLEGLAALARPRRVRSLRESAVARAERQARCCYDHLAGAVGVAVTDALCDRGALDRATLGLVDPAPLRALGVDPDGLRGRRRPLTRACEDWSERRPHLAGALGAALLSALLDTRALTRRAGSRAVAVTPAGAERLREVLDLDVGAVVARGDAGGAEVR